MTSNPALQGPSPDTRYITPSCPPRARHARRIAQDKLVYEPGQPFNPRRYRVLGLTPADIVSMQPDLKPGPKTIYACLWALTEPETGLCAISYAALARKVNLKRSRFFVDLGVLKSRKLLKIERNGPHVNTFRFIYQDVFDVQRAGCLLKDVQRAGHQEKRRPAGRTSTNREQTSMDREQGFAYSSSGCSLSSEIKQDLTSQTSAQELLLQNRERDKGFLVGRSLSSKDDLPTKNPSSNPLLTEYLESYTSAVGRPPEPQEVSRISLALNGGDLDRLRSRVDARIQNGLTVTGYGIFELLAKECSGGKEVRAKQKPKPQPKTKLDAMFEQIEKGVQL